ncbi:methylenetetrahydrofolate reductase [Acetobacter sp.]|uniref:methylenetetrahydrofolate reductase n=1 Tax=Acetobacter sp. TaxID=440 RepID=UPI0025C30388|nr:methylenetetrahydrofolate reductase [Acetobacter sp.]MCI1301335.1 methylenetetrahydrofolate reductase [Acetobacter sp.]
MKESSIELLPSRVLELSGVLPNLECGAMVFVTWLPGVPFEKVLAACDLLELRGYLAVPHVAARNIPDEQHLQSLCTALIERKITRILLIAGGAEKPAGAFSDTVQVLETGMLARLGIRTVYVAGHPEGHPQASDGELIWYLLRKQELARQQGLTMQIVTQFCFEPASVLDWEKGLRSAGVSLPINLGVYGLTSPRMLVRYGLACGVGQSLRFMQKQRWKLHRWSRPCNPLPLIDAVASVIAETPETSFHGVHFFPFGAVARTLEWRHALSSPASS